MSYFGLADMLDNVVRRLQGPRTDLVLPEVDLTGSVAVLTGASTVTGQEMVRALARRGAKVIVAARNVEDVKAAAEDIDLQNIRVIKCDLASFTSVREFCRQVEEEEEKVDILINNAETFSTERVLTEDGQDTVFQVNHLSRFLLTNLMLDKLKASKAARIINVSNVPCW